MKHILLVQPLLWCFSQWHITGHFLQTNKNPWLSFPAFGRGFCHKLRHLRTADNQIQAFMERVHKKFEMKSWNEE